MNELLQREYFGNTVLSYCIAAGIILIGSSLLRIFRKTILIRLKKWTDSTSSNTDNFIVGALEKFALPALHWLIIYWGINYLTLSVQAEHVMEIAITIVVTYFILRILSSSLLLLITNRVKRQERGEEKIKQLGGLMIIINIVLWTLGVVFLIDNLGYNVTTIVTGLGIGGIAVALAAQNILGDLFNYFVIFFDRPFEVGDFITVDDKMGEVEYIGIKTTRLRSLGGEVLVIGNSNLTAARIHNYKQMMKRRVVFTIDVSYGTPPEKLEMIPGLIKKIILEQQQVSFDRAHLAAYREWSVRYEVVYFFLSPDYNKYMDTHQAIHFRIFRLFKELEIAFATPSQTLHLSPANGNETQQPEEKEKSVR
ncbi:MAG TPA: mechanosensitive ion channel family protein [Ohtaekwangia sp.]